MLIEFKVANYRSIRAEQTLSMVASNYSDELPQNLISCDHVPGLKGTKLVKAVALYGANASGKSNIVAALRFFAEFVRDSATTKLQPGALTGAQPFKLDPACLTQPSKFEITAVINGIRTLYGIEMTRERVTSEYLVAYPKGRPQVWFERDWEERKGKYAWSKSTAYFKHDAALREKTREQMAFLSVASHFDHAKSATVWKWIEKLIDIMDQSLFGGAAKSALHIDGIRTVLESITKVADLGVAELATRKLQQDEIFAEFVRGYIQDRSFLKTVAAHGLKAPKGELPESAGSNRKSERLIPELRHRGKDGTLVPLDYRDEESTGTQRYLELSAELLFASTFGFLITIDEIETGLHPLLFHKLVGQYLSYKVDTVGSQLLFTTHNPLLLDQTLLRRDQIWFTEKDQEGATRLYPLTDFKPRKDESLVKGYLAGRYGGIPFIPEGLKF